MMNSYNDNVSNYSFNSINDYIVANDPPQQNNNFFILNYNAHSISSISKFNSFKEKLFLLPHKVHVIAIGESWIQYEMKDIYKLPGYNAIFSCREDGYGGVVMYIDDSIKFTTSEVRTGYLNSIEVVFPSIKVNSGALTLLSYYRSPKFPTTEFIRDLDYKLDLAGNKNLLTLGDSNVDTSTDESISTRFKNVVQSNNFQICNTHVTRPSSNAIIDHVLCNFTDHISISISTVSVEKHISDHCFLLLNLHLKANNSSETITYTTKTVDYTAVNNELANKIDLSSVNQYQDPDMLCEYLINTVTETVRKHTKTKEKKIKKKHLLCPWITENMTILIKHKSNLLKKLKRNPNNGNLKTRYKRCNDLVNTCLRDLKNNYYKNKFTEASGNPKATWRELNNLLGRNQNQSIDQLTNADGYTISEPTQIANELNQYFAEAPSSMSSKIPSHHDDDINKWNNLVWNTKDFQVELVENEEVTNIIAALDTNKSAGVEGITVKCVKTCKNILAPALTKLANICFTSGKYPNLLKIQKITPIFKKGDKTKAENYRPISVLPVFNKILEKLVFRRLYSFLESENFFYVKQYGFRPKTSTSTATLELLDMIIENIENRKVVGGIFLDLSKAFDTINHAILLRKLEYAGIRGVTLNLLENYLSNRTQYVAIEKAYSNRMDVKIGVPQGSVLGPLLFLIFINDMSKLPLLGILMLFADDSSLFYPGSNEHETVPQINHDLDIISEYLRINKLTINVSKTKFLQFKAPNKTTDITELNFKGNTIAESSSVKYLGLTINNTLNWKDHIQQVCKKISPAIGIIQKFRHKLQNDVLRLIYFSLVHSHISYMIEIWGTKRGAVMNSLQVLHKKAIKNMYKVEMRTSTLTLYTSISKGILPIRALHFLKVSIWMFKNVNKQFRTNIGFHEQQHEHDTRTRRNLCLPQVRTNYGKTRIKYTGALIYNDIPPDIKTVLSLGIFKDKLKLWINNDKLVELC